MSLTSINCLWAAMLYKQIILFNNAERMCLLSEGKLSNENILFKTVSAPWAFTFPIILVKTVIKPAAESNSTISSDVSA